MTHLPPIPDAASAPYPLHPAPISEEQKRATAEAEEAAAAAAQAEAAEALLRARTTAVGLGLGAALLVGAAAWGLQFYARRGQRTTPRTGSRNVADDKRKRGRADRSRVAAGRPYEVSYFARKHGISAAAARAIIQEAGPDRKAANKLALSCK